MLYVFSIYCRRAFQADFQYEILRHDEEEGNSVESNAFFFRLMQNCFSTFNYTALDIHTYTIHRFWQLAISTPEGGSWGYPYMKISTYR